MEDILEEARALADAGVRELIVVAQDITRYGRDLYHKQMLPELLHELGFKTVALALRDDSLALNDPRLLAEPKLAMVLGTEGDGLASSTIAACDYTVKIPMSHGVDSLNVAAASAVAFYQLALLNG